MSNLIGEAYYKPCPTCGREMGNAAGLGSCATCLNKRESDDSFFGARRAQVEEVMRLNARIAALEGQRRTAFLAGWDAATLLALRGERSTAEAANKAWENAKWFLDQGLNP